MAPGPENRVRDPGPENRIQVLLDLARHQCIYIYMICTYIYIYICSTGFLFIPKEFPHLGNWPYAEELKLKSESNTTNNLYKIILAVEHPERFLQFLSFDWHNKTFACNIQNT